MTPVTAVLCSPSRVRAAACVAAAGLLAMASAVAAPPTAPAPRLEPADAKGVMAAIRATKARAVLVNIWATWCGPCREEFPELLKVGRDLKDRGLALVLVSGDFDDGREDAVKFLADHGVDFTTYIKSGGDEAFINGLAPQWSGSLPTTMVFDGSGRLRHLREGKLDYKQFRDLVLDVIDQPNKGPEKENGR
jgi:thiol-disulfide isomerase/thioredoxin